jgi:transposase
MSLKNNQYVLAKIKSLPLGLTCEQVAAKIGCSTSSASKLVKICGYETRCGRNKTFSLTSSDSKSVLPTQKAIKRLEQIRALAEGLTTKEVAEALGCEKANARLLIRRYNYQRQKRGLNQNCSDAKMLAILQSLPVGLTYIQLGEAIGYSGKQAKLIAIKFGYKDASTIKKNAPYVTGLRPPSRRRGNPSSRPDSKMAELIRSIPEGLSVKDLAERFGIFPAAAARLARRHQYKVKSNSLLHGPRKETLERISAVKLLPQGLTYKEIAETIGCTLSQAKSAAYESNYKASRLAGRQKYKNIEMAEIIKGLPSGLSYVELAKRLGCKTDSARRIAIKFEYDRFGVSQNNYSARPSWILEDDNVI